MGAKDTKAKEYLSDNGRFADLCNAVLFGGAQLIQADRLQEKDTTEVLSALGTDEKEIQFQRWRDILKQVVVKSYGDVHFMLIGIENQSEIHYAMPVKVMIYDALNYGAQVKEAAKKHQDEKKTMTNAEFLSGFYKEDKLTPVITLTVYLGAEQWDGPRSIGVNISLSKEGCVTNMCKAWEDQKEEGREEGRELTLLSLVKDGLLSADEAAKRLSITEEEVEKRLR